MNKQSLSIIFILASGSILSVAYGVSTVISDSGITTPSLTTTTLTVSGSCSGCGGGEGSFTSYSTQFNGTIVGTNGWASSGLIKVNNTGTVLFMDAQPMAAIVTKTGSIVTTTLSSGDQINHERTIDQSGTGVYQLIYTSGNNRIDVYKNGVLLQKIGITSTNFMFGPGNFPGMAISSNGKYIAVQGVDSGGASDRLLIFQGS